MIDPPGQFVPVAGDVRDDAVEVGLGRCQVARPRPGGGDFREYQEWVAMVEAPAGQVLSAGSGPVDITCLRQSRRDLEVAPAPNGG